MYILNINGEFKLKFQGFLTLNNYYNHHFSKLRTKVAVEK